MIGVEAETATSRSSRQRSPSSGTLDWKPTAVPQLYIASRNEFFWPIAQMFEVTLRESFRLAALGDHRPRAFEEHRAVMEAIEAGDADRAREATWVLLGNASDDLVRIRGKDPFRKR